MNVLEPIFRILNHFVSLPPSSTSQQLWSGLHMNCPKFLLLILNLHLIRITCDFIHSRFHIEGISLMMSLAGARNKQTRKIFTKPSTYLASHISIQLSFPHLQYLSLPLWFFSLHDWPEPRLALAAVRAVALSWTAGVTRAVFLITFRGCLMTTISLTN